MNLRLRYFSIVLSCLLVATIACALPNSKQVQAILIFAPGSTATFSPDDFNSAVEVLNKRLNEAEIAHKVSTDGSTNIRVELYDQDDVEDAIQLATHGGLIFFEADETLSVGDPVPAEPIIILDAHDFAEAHVESEGATDKLVLSLTMSPEGKAKLADYTAAHVGGYLAVAHNGTVIMNPKIMQEITGGQTVIQGDLDVDMLKGLAAEINSGPMPFDLKLIDQSSP